MDRQNPVEYLRAKGVRFKSNDRGKHEVSFPCPGCGQVEPFSMNVKTGAWQCFRASCGVKGGLYDLKVLWKDAYPVAPAAPRSRPERTRKPKSDQAQPEQRWTVEEWHQALMKGEQAEAARRYLKARKLKPDTWKLARLGWVAAPPGGKGRPSTGRNVRARAARRGDQGCPGLVVLPVYGACASPGGEVSMVKLRWVPPFSGPNKYQRVKGGDTVLFAPVGLGDPTKPVLVVGGELDTLSVIQQLRAGGDTETAVVCSPGGEGSWNEAMTAALASHEDIVIVYDSDAAGERGAEQVAKQLGRHRCRIGAWPEGCNDANAALVEGKLDFFDIQGVITAAKHPLGEAIQTVQSIGKAVIELFFTEDGAGVRGFSTGLGRLDDKSGGFRPGEVTVLTGETGTGKTTLATQLIGQVCRDRPSLACPFEGGPKPFIQTLLWQLLGGDPLDAGRAACNEALSGLGRNLWVFDHYGRVSTEVMRETMLFCLYRLGIKFFLWDHLQFMCGRGGDQWDNQDSMIQMAQEVIAASDAHLLLINHPNDADKGKSYRKVSRDERIVQLRDLKGHSTIRQDFANAWSIWRPRGIDREAEEDDTGFCEAGLVILKNRDPRGGEGPVQLRFMRSQQRFFAR